nr:hypothetical protein [uncultured Cohaesibacter sp.]
MIARIAERIGEGGLSYCTHCNPSPCPDCPFLKLRPKSPAGQAVADLIKMPSVWRRNPFTNEVIGLDSVEMVTRCPSVLDLDLFKALMLRAEAGYMIGLGKAKGHVDED